MTDNNTPTTIRLDSETREQIKFLQKIFKVKTVTQLIVYCVNRVYRDEQAKEKR